MTRSDEGSDLTIALIKRIVAVHPNDRAKLRERLAEVREICTLLAASRQRWYEGGKP